MPSPRPCRLAGFAAALVLTGLSATRGAAEPLELGIGLGASRYDQSSRVSASGSLRPFVRYAGDVGLWNLDASAQRRLEYRSRSAHDSLSRIYGSTSDRAALDVHRRWSPFDQVRLRAGYAYTRNLLDTDIDAAVEDGPVTRWSGVGEVDQRHFEVDGRVRSTSYSGRPDEESGVAAALALRVVPVRQRIHALFAGLAERRLFVGGREDLRTRMATVGARRLIDPIYTASLEVGAVENRFANGAGETRPAFLVGIERSPGRIHALELEAGASFHGDSLAAYRLETGYRLASGRLWLRAESAADAEGGQLDGATRTRRYVAGVLDTLNRATVLGFEASYVHASLLRDAAQRTEVVRMTFWALRRVQPWLGARLAGSYAREPMRARYLEPILRRIRIDAELVVLHSSNLREDPDPRGRVPFDRATKGEA